MPKRAPILTSVYATICRRPMKLDRWISPIPPRPPSLLRIDKPRTGQLDSRLPGAVQTLVDEFYAHALFLINSHEAV